MIASSIDMRDVNELTGEATSLHTALQYFALFLPLLDEQADFQTGPPTFKPRLAESYDFSEDRKVITFHLRHDVVWSDGEPVTAEDVRWTWQAQIAPEVAWSLASAKESIRDVEVVDPYTVRFHFDKVYATQLLDANMGVILPRHAWSQLPFSEWRNHADWFLSHLVVDGPFELESWEPEQRIVLKRNQRFFEPDRPRSERIVFRIVPDRSSQLAMLRAGEVQIIDWARPADAESLEADPQIEILSYVPRGFYAFVWNVAHPLFASKQVRQALTLAIDRQAIIDTVYYGYAKVSDSPFNSDVWVHNNAIEPWPYDPGRAKEILAAEGFADTDGDGILERDGQPLRFEILTVAGNELRQDILVMVQEQLARVGVDARQRAVEFNSMLARERAHDFDASSIALAIPTTLDLSFYFHSRAIAEGYNFGSYSNPEVDQLLDEIMTQVDQLAAKPLFDRLQVLLHEDQPVTFLYEPQRLIPARKTLAYASPNAISTFFNLQEWELREDAGSP